jgi:hypothetical protein
MAANAIDKQLCSYADQTWELATARKHSRSLRSHEVFGDDEANGPWGGGYISLPRIRPVFLVY